MSRRSQSRATRTVFNPGAVPIEHLEAITVGRDAELEVIDQSLRAAATTGARPHLLVIGPRGSGKTHLFALAAYRARTDPELAEGLAVAWLPEDAYAITSYRELLQSVVETLAVGDHRWLTPTGPARLASDELGLERLLLDTLGDKVLLLMIENLDRHMQLLGPLGQRQLRGFLHEHQCTIVLASAPALFRGVSDYEAPFYGSFRVIHPGELTLDEGRELLLRIARLDGDEELAVYLASDKGRRRLAAIADLAGGSPRLWQLLAACMDVAALDELVPLFVKLLDELTPYYKARLDELAPARAKLITHLCRSPSGTSGWRPVGARTVKDLAEAAGMSEQSASKQLSELELARFVRSRKAARGDKRATFYEIREPLLRHCLELKENRGKPLELIVSVLRDWYDTTDLRQAFLGAHPEAAAEHYLGSALAGSNALELNSTGDPKDLLLAARSRLAAHGDDGCQSMGSVRSELAAVLAEAAVVGAWEGPDAARRVALTRLERWRGAGLEDPARRCVEATLTQLAARVPCGQDAPVGETASRVAEGLSAAAEAAELARLPPRDVAEVGLLAATWLVSTEHVAESLPLLEEIDRATAHLGLSDPLRLAVLAAMAYAHANIGNTEAAIALGAQVMEHRIRSLGPDHFDTLTSRYNYATWLRREDPCKSAVLLEELLAEGIRALGSDHPQVLSIRNAEAVTHFETGQLAAARDLLANLVDDSRRVFGPKHPTTLIIRSNHAFAVQEAGDPFAARELSAQLVAEYIDVWGPTHRQTLQERCVYARCVEQTGDPAHAFRLFEDLSRSDVGYLMYAVKALADAVDSDPSGARSQLAAVLRPGMRTTDAVVVITAVAVSPDLKGRLDGWLLEVLRDIGFASLLCLALVMAVGAAPAFGESSEAILRRWLALLVDESYEPYALATRVLQAGDAFLHGDDTLLLGLPAEERRMVNYLDEMLNSVNEADAD